MVQLVSYDLLTPGKGYETLFTRLAAHGGRRVLLSEWVVVTGLTADALWRDLNTHIDTNDRLLVTELTKNGQWGAGRLLITDTEMQGILTQARC